MQKNKEDAYDNFIEMIKHSWTYAKLTKEEIEQFYRAFSLEYECVRKMLKGTYLQRWNNLQALYHAFLSGVGYSDAVNWRSDKDAPKF